MPDEPFYFIVGLAVVLVSLAWLSMPFVLFSINSKLKRSNELLSALLQAQQAPGSAADNE